MTADTTGAFAPAKAAVGGTPPDEAIRVLIIDDHIVVAQSIAQVLSEHADIAVIDIAACGHEGVVRAARCDPTVVLIDYRLPDADGVAVAREIRAQDRDHMVVMLTGEADDRVLLAAIEAGCCGFVTKDQPVCDVVTAVRAAAAGEASIAPAMLARLLSRLRPGQPRLARNLSARELEVLTLLAEGLSNQDIAARLFLSVYTVRNHVSALLVKLEAHSKLEAVATACREGIIRFP